MFNIKCFLIRISTPILYLTHRPLDGQGPVQIFLIMINIVNLTRTPPPIVAAVPPLPPAPLYSQDTSPKHSIICLRRTIPSNHGSNTSIPKLLSWLDIMQHNTTEVFKQPVQGCAAVEYAGSARVERLGQGQPGETGLSHYSPPPSIYSCYICTTSSSTTLLLNQSTLATYFNYNYTTQQWPQHIIYPHHITNTKDYPPTTPVVQYTIDYIAEVQQLNSAKVSSLLFWTLC